MFLSIFNIMPIKVEKPVKKITIPLAEDQRGKCPLVSRYNQTVKRRIMRNNVKVRAPKKELISKEEAARRLWK